MIDKAIEGNGWADGISQSIAHSACYLEAIGLVGINPVISFLRQTPHLAAPPTINDDDTSSIIVNINGQSSIPYAEIVSAYFLERLTEATPTQLILRNTTDPLFFVPYLRSRQALQMQWQDIAGQTITAFREPNQPHCHLIYQHQQPTLSHTIIRHQAISLSSLSRSLKQVVDIQASADFAEKYHHHVQHGIDIDDSQWALLLSAAQAVLVENDEYSEQDAGATEDTPDLE